MTIEYGKEYDYQDVKELVKERQLYILDEIVKICEKHNLTYWLDGGTLLGAVRHKGFIPWDDDIDIGIMRDEYEQLVPILKDELPFDLQVQDIYTDDKYRLPYVQIRDKNSKIVEDYRTYNGLFIDIFPFDIIPNSQLLQTIQRVLFMIFELMYIHTDINKLNISKKKGIYLFSVKISIYFLSKLGQVFGLKGYKKLYYFIVNISKLNPGDLVGDGLTGSWAYYKSIRKKDVYLPVKKLFFEKKQYNVPNNFDTYLRTLYGNSYMVPINMNNVHIKKVIFYK